MGNEAPFLNKGSNIKAKACDPVSAYGGIIAANRPLDSALIEAIGDLFLEVIIAPAADKKAVELLAKKKKFLNDLVRHIGEPVIRHVKSKA